MEEYETEESIEVVRNKESRYDFDNVTVDFMLSGSEKSIIIKIDEYIFKLSWTAIYSHTFNIELSKYNKEKKKYILQQGLQYNKDFRICYCTYTGIRGGKEVLHIDIASYIDKCDMPTHLLYQFDCIIRKLPFIMSLEDIIGDYALKASGLYVLFRAVNEEKREIQKKYGTR